jgi:hypothetical protein
MSRYPRKLSVEPTLELPLLRFEIDEVVKILRMSRAQVYNRIAEGAIRTQKDGARTYVTLTELERYVQDCERRASPAETAQQLPLLRTATRRSVSRARPA